MMERKQTNNPKVKLRKWKNYSAGTATIVRISQIENKILSLTGVVDISGTKINDVAANFSVTDNKIPVLGVITHD